MIALADRIQLIARIRELTVRRNTADWIALFEQVGVPCGPINTIAEVFADPQVQARGTQISMTHCVAGDIPLVASPLRLSRTPVQYRCAPPLLGQDTHDVLAALMKMTPEAIAALIQQGVVA